MDPTPLSANDLRLHFPSIMHRLVQGESFHLIYRSRTVATLVSRKKTKSVHASDPWDFKSFAASLQIAGHPVDPVEIDRLIDTRYD